MKKVLVLGGTGRIGGLAVEYALGLKKYTVSVLARSPEKVKDKFKEKAPQINVIKGDIFDPVSLKAAFEGQDVILSLIGPPDLEHPNDFYKKASSSIIEALRGNTAKLVFLQGYSSLPQNADKSGVEDATLGDIPNAFPKFLDPLISDMKVSTKAIMNSGLKYVIICPPHIPEKALRYNPVFGMTGVFQHTKKYRTEKNQPLIDHWLAKMFVPARVISQEDLADFFVRCIDDDSFVGSRVAIAY
ncbi:hypothetical protein HDV06_005128 [Boothiomyces sp. JEL0866]|nr:hypothetical protein HDV06_005128 [Boothiomyces sp. JEL0866]